MATGYVASASSGPQSSVASFNISASLGTGARAGLVFVVTYATATPVDTGVTWNGVAMTPLFSAADTNTEPGVVTAYFLDNISNGAVTVSRTNNATVSTGYAISMSSASLALFVSQVKTIGGGGTVVTNGNASEAGTAASGEVALDDGSPGSSSMRFAVNYTGNATPLGAGTNSTSLQTDDRTALGSSLVRETNVGQGSRNVGFATGVTDDYAVVAVAVSEAGPKTITLGLLDGSNALYAPTVVAPSTTSIAKVSLESGGTPSVRTGHSIKVRTRVQSGSGVLRAALYEGANNRSGNLESSALSTSLANYTLSISEANATNITDYSNLELWFWGYSAAGGSVVYEVDQIYVEIPESGADVISLGLLDGSNALYAPTLAVGPVTISLGLLDGSNALYAPTLVAKNTLTVPLLDGSSALYAPTLATLNTLTVPLLDGANALYAPTLAGKNSVSLGLIDGSATLYAPTIVGTYAITLGLIDSGAALYAPTFFVDQFISLDLLESAATLYEPTFTTFKSITLGLLDSGPALYEPTVFQDQFVSVPLLDAAAALYAPSLLSINYISLSLLDASNALYAPSVVVPAEDKSGTASVTHSSSTSASGTKDTSGSASVSSASSTTATGSKQHDTVISVTHAADTSGLGTKDTSGTASASSASSTQIQEASGEHFGTIQVSAASSIVITGNASQAGEGSTSVQHVSSTSVVGFKSINTVVAAAHASSTAAAGSKAVSAVVFQSHVSSTSAVGGSTRSGSISTSNTTVVSVASFKSASGSVAGSSASSTTANGRKSSASGVALSNSSSTTSSGVHDGRNVVLVTATVATLAIGTKATSGTLLATIVSSITLQSGDSTPVVGGAYATIAQAPQYATVTHTRPYATIASGPYYAEVV